MSPSRNTAEAVCEFIYETETLQPFFDFLLFLTFLLPYPSQRFGQPQKRIEKNGLWATEQKPSMDAGIPAWLIHSFVPSFVAFSQTAWWPDL